MKLQITLLLILLATATSAKADPLVFSNVTVTQGGSQVDLFSNAGGTLFGPQLTFRADISGLLPAGSTDTFLATYNDSLGASLTQSFQIPLFGTVSPPFTIVFGFVAPNVTFVGVPATLTIDLLNSSADFIIPGGPNAGHGVNSYTFSFNVAQPVPEPASVGLLTAGIGCLVLKRKRL